MFKFYIPFYYLFHSRLKTKMDMLSWIIIFIIPQFSITYAYVHLDLETFALLFVLSQVIFNTLYEIGYIENDIHTTKNEKIPTLRLDKQNTDYVKKNYINIVYIKYFIVILFTGLLIRINSHFSFDLNIKSFIVLLIVNRIFFYWHNSIRNRINLLTFSVLAITKYIFPIVLFVGSNHVLYASLLSITAFPALRIIEHSTHKRYTFSDYAKIIGNHDKFRILYYSTFLLLFVLLYLSSLITVYDFTISISVMIYFSHNLFY